MNAQRITGYIDENHQLSALVPDSVPTGPVTIYVVPPQDEDEAGALWANGVADSWRDELADERQDIYTLEDGQPVNES